MANTYTISLPDDLKPYADKLADERRLSEVIADFLRKEQQRDNRKVLKTGELSK